MQGVNEGVRQQSRSISCAIWITVTIATIVMASALGWAIVAGDLSEEGSIILRIPWGVVSLVEIYVGMALFGCWVFWRESNIVSSCAWMAAVAIAGNIASCIYVVLALRAARGDVMRFWMGARTRPEGGN